MSKSTPIVLILWCLAAGIAHGQSIVSTVHNLSASGPGTVKATTESEVCVFCHAPHTTSPRTPLWNRSDPGINYTLYSSSTTEASLGQPTGSSILCLSCHDGTIALGAVLNREPPVDFSSGVTLMPAGRTNLSKDLSDDHPISFHFDTILSGADGELVDPGSISDPVVLEAGRMECTSCHDAHNNDLGDFLVVSTAFSDLCLRCHTNEGWDLSSHKLSTATWNGSGQNPWFHTEHSTVAANACENCHDPHSAGGSMWLMNHQSEESNCLGCHNGSVASTSIQAQLMKEFSHDVFAFVGVHDPTEPAVVQTSHVECTDCHNPHATRNSPATAPSANGFIAGVPGVDTNGSPVDPLQYEYELCYRCHADSPIRPGASTPRQFDQTNVRLEFDPGNLSYHPVEAAGKNPNSPSLISPWTESSVMYCTDCHASNGSGSPAGPHGSTYPSILRLRYETDLGTAESAGAYALCYDCHSRSSILSDQSFDKHRKHVAEHDVPCNVCHDPHGVSSSQADVSHLINFDLSVVSPDPETGRLEFNDLGLFRGECYLDCHGERHGPLHYPD